MKDYEVIIEEINPCGGTEHSIKTIIEARAESPEAYVQANGRFPIIEILRGSSGDTFITTGDGGGYMVKYAFSE